MAAIGLPFHAMITAAAVESSRGTSSSSASSTLGLDDFPADAAAFDLSDFIMSESDQALHFSMESSFPAVDAQVYRSSAAAPPMNMGDECGERFGNTLSNDDDINSGGGGGGGGGGGELGSGRRPRDDASRIAFRMKSEVEIIDDGFKWRKYGKKSVKNSPNPRNYYRCSTEGCWVKKRVERDGEDASYVITTYEGVHNHMSPGVVYYASRDTVSGRYFVAGCQIPSPSLSPSPSSSSPSPAAAAVALAASSTP